MKMVFFNPYIIPSKGKFQTRISENNQAVKNNGKPAGLALENFILLKSMNALKLFL